jgi:hypothetical protein
LRWRRGRNAFPDLDDESMIDKENSMRKTAAILLALCLLGSFSLLAQDTAGQDDSKAGVSMKAMSVTGKISEDGKSFVNDKDGKTYTIDNPDVVKGHEGHHVTLKAKVNSSTSEVNVVSLKMAPQKQQSTN